MNQKTKKIDTGATILADTLYAGMKVQPTSSSGSLKVDNEYSRDAANTAWLEAPLLTGITHSAGDLIKDGATHWARWAKGTAYQVPRVNSDASDTEWFSGLVVVINLDDTGNSATIPSSDTNLTTYSLGTNVFSKIMARATVNIDPLGTAGTDQIITYQIKIGSTTKSYTWRNDPTTQKRDVITLELSAVQTGSATIAVSHGAPAADGSTTSKVKSLYVFGVT